MLKSKNICRVCSSRGAYDIFATIPAYLHGSSNEFLLWKKDIAKLLEETTGLTINPNDNLPKKICALCISYLKHASIFRTQAINNYLSLQTAQQMLNDDTDELSGDIKKLSNNNKFINNATNILNYIDEDNNDENLSIRLTNLPNNTRKNISQLTTSSTRRNDEELTNNYLNLLFNKDTNKTANTLIGGSSNQKKNHFINHQQHQLYQTAFYLEDDETFLAKDFEFDELPSAASSDENEITEQTRNFFNYKETNFEEDDIINILKDYNVTINIPDTDKERKCNSCFRRFMFEDTYLDHIEICVEHKLQTSVQALNRLYGLRRKKMISPHEFIRRMFFSLKKISEWIGTLVLPDTNPTNIIKNEIDLLDIPNNDNNDDILIKNNSNTNINWKTNHLIKEKQEFDLVNQPKLKATKINNNEIKSNDIIRKEENPLLEILKTNSSKSLRKNNLITTSRIEVQSFPNDINTATSLSVSNNFAFPVNANQDSIVKNKMDHEKIIALFED